MPETSNSAATQDGDAPLLPWDPQPGEPGTSFEGFVLYRRTPPGMRHSCETATSRASGILC